MAYFWDSNLFFFFCISLYLVTVKFTYLMAVLMKTDMVAIPRPEPETRKISTNSLFLLKYWPTIKVAGSRVMATPTPIWEAQMSYEFVSILVNLMMFKMLINLKAYIYDYFVIRWLKNVSHTI